MKTKELAPTYSLQLQVILQHEDLTACYHLKHQRIHVMM